MLQIKVVMVGKTRESWLSEALDSYTQRLRGKVAVEWVTTKDDAQQRQQLAKEKSILLLDPSGKQLDSPAFSELLFKNLEDSGGRLVFAIGGPDGFPQDLRANYPMISLSALTFTHQITRLVLMEQLYRAWEIHRGSPYHRV